MTNILNDEDLEPPGRPDFRRVGRGIPFVIGPEGKRVRYSRSSNAGKILDDESNLTDWKLRTTVVGAAQRPELMAQVSTLDANSDKKLIRNIAEECLTAGRGQERSVKGTAVHAMFDHIDRKDDWQPAPQWMELCVSYMNALELWGLVVVDIEAHCIHHELRLAGTMDRRYKTTKLLVAPDGSSIPIGSLIAADTKTGATLEYASGSYATQLAAYAYSSRYNVETDETEEFHPPTFKDWGLVVHADSGQTQVEMYWVDLNAGLQGLQLAREVKGWRQRSDLLTLAPAPVAATSTPKLAPEAPRSLSEPSRVQSLANHTQERIRALLAYSAVAGKQLQREWPNDIPGLKAGGHSWDDLQDIITVVEKVEGDHQVPFFTAWEDPEEEAKRRLKALHPSNAIRATQPAMSELLAGHPKRDLILSWGEEAKKGQVDKTINHNAVYEGMLDFAGIDTTGWSESPIRIDEQLSLFLAGTLRAMGYKNGLQDLGRVKPEEAIKITQAAFSISVGTAMLLYQEDGTAILRTNIVKGTK